MIKSSRLEITPNLTAAPETGITLMGVTPILTVSMNNGEGKILQLKPELSTSEVAAEVEALSEVAAEVEALSEVAAATDSEVDAEIVAKPSFTEFKFKHHQYISLLLGITGLEAETQPKIAAISSDSEAETVSFMDIYKRELENVNSKVLTESVEQQKENNLVYRAERGVLTLIGTGVDTLTVHAKKLLLYALHLLTIINTNKTLSNNEVVFNLEDYRRILALASLKKLREHIPSTLNLLSNLYLEVNGEKFPLPKTQIVDSATCKIGVVTVKFNYNFALHYIENGYIRKMPANIFSIGTNYSPNILPLCLYLYIYKEMNQNKNVVKLKTALYYAGFSHLDCIKQSHHKQLIFSPFSKIMDTIFGERWWFEGKNKTPIQRSEVTYKNSSEIRIRFLFERGGTS